VVAGPPPVEQLTGRDDRDLTGGDELGATVRLGITVQWMGLPLVVEDDQQGVIFPLALRGSFWIGVDTLREPAASAAAVLAAWCPWCGRGPRI
jgi:hypothetical protein